MIQKIHVKDSSIVLLVDYQFETSRAMRFIPMLSMHGTIKRAQPFNYEHHEALSPTDRCFDNAMEAVLGDGTLSYVEGVAIMGLEEGGVFLLPHGWCEDEKGNVVDPTNHKTQHDRSVRYWGIPIRTDYHLNWKLRVGYFGCLDGDVLGNAIGIHYDDPSMWLANATNCTGAPS